MVDLPVSLCNGIAFGACAMSMLMTFDLESSYMARSMSTLTKALPELFFLFGPPADPDPCGFVHDEVDEGVDRVDDERDGPESDPGRHPLPGRRRDFWRGSGEADE